MAEGDVVPAVESKLFPIQGPLQNVSQQFLSLISFLFIICHGCLQNNESPPPFNDGLCDGCFDSADERHQPSDNREGRQVISSKGFQNLIPLEKNIPERLASIESFHADVANSIVDG